LDSSSASRDRRLWLRDAPTAFFCILFAHSTRLKPENYMTVQRT
jgi:hypothetical protein